MSITTTSTTPGFNLNRIEHVTATVETQNSTYVVIARKGWVKMILTHTTGDRPSWAPVTGDVYEGELLLHAGTTLHLIAPDGTPVLRTSRVLAIDVHEN